MTILDDGRFDTRRRRRTSVRWLDYSPVACATALRCDKCGWRASRRWERATVRAMGSGVALEEAVTREARRWLGDPSAEHHREVLRLLGRLVGTGVAEALGLHRPPRPYVPGYACHHRVTELAVALFSDIGERPLAVVVVRPGDDVVAVMGAAMEARQLEWPRDGDGGVGLRVEVVKRLAWRRVE